MRGPLAGQVAVVTGASRGIGEAIAVRYAMAGAKVRMAENAMMMIHAPWTFAMGNSAELREQAEANARRYLERTAASLRSLGMPVRSLVEGSRPATAILDVAEREQVDLIMLSTHGRGGMDRLMLGSVADRVVHHSRCPVLLIPARAGDA
jgi:nucleotide-binding universal stress UspA family protein